MDKYYTLGWGQWGTTSPTIAYPHPTAKEAPMKADARSFTDEELEAELERRREAREAARRPSPADDPDFGILLDNCAEVIRQVTKDGYYDEDCKTYIFEAAMTAIYGPRVFGWIAEKMDD